MKRLPIFRLVALLLGVLAVGRGQVTWDGGGGNNRWGTANNWSGNAVPSSTTDVLLDNSSVANLPATIELRGTQNARSLSFDTAEDIAIINGTGNRTLNLYNGSITRSAGSAGSHSLDFGALALRADGVFAISGSGSLTISSDIEEAGAGATSVTKSGTGLLILSGANTFTAGIAVTGGTLQVSADAHLGNAANDVTLSGGGALATTGSFTAGAGRTFTVSGSGGLDVASGQTLTFGTAGQLAGSGTLTKSGDGTLTLTALPTFTDTLELNAGTLSLSNITWSLNTLNITGNSTIDFAGVSTLSVTNLTIAAGVTLNITNWVNASDYFTVQNWTGAVRDLRGVAPMNQVAFTGFTSPNTTRWQSYDDQITPVPEPSTYGALLLLVSGGVIAWRRRQRSGAISRSLS